MLSTLIASSPVVCALAIAGAPSLAKSGGDASRTFEETIPGSAVSIELIEIPAGKVRLPGAEEGAAEQELEVERFWITTREIPWEVYDAFVFSLDERAGLPAVDGLTRPTKPYLTVDRGFGHDGHPALSMSLKAANAFCEWLSARSGRSYRIPTQAEWVRACRGDAPASAHAEAKKDEAWVKGNASRMTRVIGEKAANPFGVHDMHGNVAEWCIRADGEAIVIGGSFKNKPPEATCNSIQIPTPMWNDRDPQLPKSVWWLADADFLGLRVVCEEAPEEDGEPK